MIQRIQTVWLLLAMACGVLLLYFPFWEISEGGVAQGMDIIGANSHAYLLGFPPVMFVTHAIAIFSFKNRKKQLRFCNINIMLFILYTLVALIILQIENHISSNFHLGDFKLGALMPLIGIILNLIAKRGIRADEELIRSMNRLR